MILSKLIIDQKAQWINNFRNNLSIVQLLAVLKLHK